MMKSNQPVVVKQNEVKVNEVIKMKGGIPMAKPTLTIPVNRDLGNQAQAVFNDMGLDIVTAVNIFLEHIVQKEPMCYEMVQTKQNTYKPTKLGGWEGKVKISDDFNNPLDDFTTIKPILPAEERMKILHSLVGSIDDPTFVEPPDDETITIRNIDWKLMDA